MDVEGLFDKVRGWGKVREISNPYTQMVKHMEETGELCRELCRGRVHNDEVKDALGDMGITWIVLADILGYYAEDCLNEAYKVVEGRKGKVVEGGFVKEEDFIKDGYMEGVKDALAEVSDFLDEDTLKEIEERLEK